MEFFMEDYLSKADEYYQLCTAGGIRSIPSGVMSVPMIYLKDAHCDISKKGNIYEYVLVIGEDKPSSDSDAKPKKPIPEPTEVSSTAVDSTASSTAVDSAAGSTASSTASSTAVDSAAAESEPKTNEDTQKQIELSIQKEKELIQQRQLLKDKLNAIKELKKLGFNNEEIKDLVGGGL
jgi:hypothetical protein